VCILTFGAVVIGLFSYVYWSTETYILSRSDHAIAADLAILISANDTAGREGLISAVNRLVANQSSENGVYLLADTSFTPVAGNLKSWPTSLKGDAGWTKFTTNQGTLDASHRPLLRATFKALPDGFHILVGREIDDLNQFASKIHVALGLGIILVLLLAAVASVMVTRRTVGRIESVNATTRTIMQSGLGERVPLRGTKDEWDQLAGNLNAMLDRIEALMGEVKQVTDNVAHDLRTPLTRMRGRLEKASMSQRDHLSDQSLINEAMADLDDVLRMFASLTRISQIESTNRTAAFRMVDLREIVGAVVELFDAAAEDKGIHLKAVGDRAASITGDRDLLFDALANLVDNAIKHGSKSGLVVVELSYSDAGAVISVSDNGPGIPSNEYEYVFRRFYRLERSRCTSGNGLGLSLVAAVVRLHEGRIELFDNAPGLKVEMQLPARGALEKKAVTGLGVTKRNPSRRRECRATPKGKGGCPPR
jgi:signal transduction histidine kinase